MNKRTSLKKEKRSKIVIITCILLGLLLICNIISLADDLKPSPYRYMANELSTMEYRLRDRDYPELINMVADNIAIHAKTIVDSSEYTALSYYYETMVYYKMFRDTDSERAEKLLEKAKDYRTQLKSDRMIKEADIIEQEYAKH